jgi:hypothetical protein
MFITVLDSTHASATVADGVLSVMCRIETMLCAVSAFVRARVPEHGKTILVGCSQTGQWPDAGR